MKKRITYKDAGVDIDAGNLFAKMIKERVKKAWPGMEKEIGGFAGGGPIPHKATRANGSVDGVGTKLKIASLLGKVDTVGQDAVAMSAVDMYVSGSRPLYLMDYLAVEKLRPEFHVQIIDGVIKACKMAGCILIGGETAELPGFFKYPWLFDLTTSVIGFPDPEISFVKPKKNFLVYGWPSFGPASNGFSLLRKVFDLNDESDKVRKKLERKRPNLQCSTLCDYLLEPTPIWISNMEYERKRGVKFAGHAHITGGGMTDNIPRILPDNLKVVINRSAWLRPIIFGLAQRLGKIETEEMERTFNNGIMIISLIDPLGPHVTDGRASLIGTVEKRKKGEKQVQFDGMYFDP